MRFTWLKPNCDEGVAPIDGYEYLVNRQPPPASYVGGTAVAIPDLRPSTKYAFRVRSRNANGHSPWSETIHVATEAEGAALTGTLGIYSEKLTSNLGLRWMTSASDGNNFYKVRVVLSPPKVYLVWTPLFEHINRVAYFKYVNLRFSPWSRVVGPPSQFRCPGDVGADAFDFCFPLEHLFFGVHYLSRVSYNLTNGDVVDGGSTLHFSLLQLEGVQQHPRYQITITQPRIEQQGHRNDAYWSTTGDTSQLLGYQVDIRRDGDRDWHEHGSLIRSEPSQVHFRQSLGTVPVATYYLRVRAVDGSMSTVATSPSTSFSVSCQGERSNTTKKSKQKVEENFGRKQAHFLAVCDFFV
ncbi:unnamed protein product [Cylicostephanus goldi]|uniref:Fibronectin type-III domain-containing protein n=1 Tax=Cylicostephanus goldi TaxID=71465 RepID=A0A3P6S4X9_CYLGO|nr:unnamed protein product [Cylicostephanus goldi]